jgi:D-beta-D-heptose 7-phosphate kinase/D-beta-D-heptose 1-phosphate adenosyltransferase
MKILVIGDSCTDIFRYGRVDRLAPEAPIPVIVPEYETSNPGMAGNVVTNLEALEADVDFITNKTKIEKIRYVCSKYNHLLLRVDENDKCERFSNAAVDELLFNSYNFDAVVISDYCKGFLLEEDIKKITSSFKCPIFLDTKKILNKFAYDVDYIKINHDEYLRNKHIIESDKILYNKVIITRGKHGCDHKGKNYPTVDVPIKDISGAGDTFLAGLVVNYIKSKNIDNAINFAQECTTIVVQKPGVSAV